MKNSKLNVYSLCLRTCIGKFIISGGAENENINVMAGGLNEAYNLAINYFRQQYKKNKENKDVRGLLSYTIVKKQRGKSKNLIVLNRRLKFEKVKL